MAKKDPAEHEVLFTTKGQGITLPKNGLIFNVKYDDSQVGWLEVSRGSIAWKPHKGRKFYTISWQELGDYVVKKGSKKA